MRHRQLKARWRISKECHAQIRIEMTSEERLQTILERVIDWLKYEEAKNVALFTLNGVGAGVIVTWLSTPQRLEYVLKGCLACLLISIVVGLVSFYPALGTHKRVRRLMALHRARRAEHNDDGKPNVLFFADIAGASPMEYLTDIDASETTKLAHDYACQIVAHAEAALAKVWLFKAAFFLTFVAYFVTVFIGFGDQILAHDRVTLPFIKTTP